MRGSFRGKFHPPANLTWRLPYSIGILSFSLFPCLPFSYLLLSSLVFCSLFFSFFSFSLHSFPVFSSPLFSLPRLSSSLRSSPLSSPPRQCRQRRDSRRGVITRGKDSSSRWHNVGLVVVGGDSDKPRKNKNSKGLQLLHQTFLSPPAAAHYMGVEVRAVSGSSCLQGELK